MKESLLVAFPEFDLSRVARTLEQIADFPGDLSEAYFERLEEIELPPEGDSPGIRARREEGLAVRLVRGDRVWLASLDGLDPGLLGQALRQVARAAPKTPFRLPGLDPGESSPASPEEAVQPEPALLEFPSEVHRALRREGVSLPLKLTTRQHRRRLQVVDRHLVPEAEREDFFSVDVELPWSRYGTLLAGLGSDAAQRVAHLLAARFRAREAAPPAPGSGVVILAPAASAVLLHEAVAHALEVDTLALSGDPEAAIGLQMGGDFLHLLDDPSAAPEGVRRRTDDEGVPVVRRWLLRRGVVEQPLADRRWAAGSSALIPGAARRSTRHLPPVPRSSHLELLPGEVPNAELQAEARGGLLVAEASRGSLNPMTGIFSLQIPWATRISGTDEGEGVGPFLLQGRVRDLLSCIIAIGNAAEQAGAGWCAKGGQKLPVWATTPAIRLEGVEVRS